MAWDDALVFSDGTFRAKTRREKLCELFHLSPEEVDVQEAKIKSEVMLDYVRRSDAYVQFIEEAHEKAATSTLFFG
ncbi:hypothetical protein LCGC14_0385930 [marine sediment metagenome]|uniref:Uncharacterized protein n=1 Tax=marine sediment metagenome TaxID=412755 RepID=A0A0F9T6M8_9ZZZZ